MKTSTLQMQRCFKLFYLSILLEMLLILWTHHNILKKKKLSVSFHPSCQWAFILVSIEIHYSVKTKYLQKLSCSTSVLFFKLLTPYFVVIVFSFFKKVLFFIWEYHEYFTKFEQASAVMLTLLRLDVRDAWSLRKQVFPHWSLSGVIYIFFSWCKTEIHKRFSSITRWFSSLNVNLSVYRKVIVT